MNLARILDEAQAVCEDSLVTDNKSDRVQKLDREDRSAAIDALTTAISMKQIAISSIVKKTLQGEQSHNCRVGTRD